MTPTTTPAAPDPTPEQTPDPGPDPMADLLDRVHAALTSADYAVLDGLTGRMAAELTRLETGGDAAVLALLQHKASRNAGCLMAAQRGLRAAQRRVAEIARARSGLVTYGPGGPGAELHHSSLLTKRF